MEPNSVRLGDTVIMILLSPSNGSDLAPAQVTRVWNPQSINVVAFPDFSTTPVVFSSVTLFENEESARASGAYYKAFIRPE